MATVYMGETGNPVVIKSLPTSHQSHYPSTWFEANKTKPEIVIPTVSTEKEGKLRSMIAGGIRGGNLKLSVAKAYLYRVLNKRVNALDAEWKSYNLLIGAKNGLITPWDLVNIREDGPLEDSTEGAADEAQDKALVTYIVAIYRINRINNESYRSAIKSKISDLLKSTNVNDLPVDLLVGTYAGWMNDKNYLKIIAVIDMYFYKFPLDEWASIRIGTLGSRFRDCASLLAFQHVTSVVGMDAISFKYWIFVPSIAAEFNRMMAGTEELDLEHSYFPYQVDLALTTKSAYSTIVNPEFYFFANAIGTLGLDDRSKNARAMLSTNIANVTKNAIIAGYVLNNKAITKTNRGGDEALGPPGDKNPAKWFSYLESNGFELTQEMREYIDKVKRGILNPRPGTIGQYVLSNF